MSGMGSLAQGFVNGYGLGLQGQRAKRANELADIQIEEAKTAQSKRDLLNEADSNAFGSQPGAPIVERGTGGIPAPATGGEQPAAAGLQPGQPSGAPTKAPDFLGQYNAALSNYLSMAADPKYKPIAHEILGRIDDLNKSADQVNGFMHRQAAEAAFPHIKTLSDPAATDEAKSAAASALATTVYPDGKTHRFVVQGDVATMLDEGGKPIMDGDKPRQMKVDDILEGATSALDTPETYLQTRRQAAKEVRADERWKEQKQFTKDENDATRKQAREMDDARTTRESARLSASTDAGNKKDFAAAVARDMAEYSKDERARMSADPAYKADPAARQKAYDEAVRRYAPIYGLTPSGVGVAPQGRTMPGAGEAIDVEVGGGAGIPAPPTAAKPTAAAPSVPVPTSGAPGAGLEPRPIAAPTDMTVQPTVLERAANAAAQGARDVGSALQAKIPTNMEQIQATAQALRADLGANRLTRDNVGQIMDLAKRPDNDLITAGLTKQEIQQLRAMAQKFGTPQ